MRAPGIAMRVAIGRHFSPDRGSGAFRRGAAADEGEAGVTGDLALQLMGDMLIASMLIGAPILGLSMLVGLLVSIVQVVTQIQEMSLTFIPKIVTVVITMFAFGPWMLKKLLAYSSAAIGNIPSYF